MEYCVQRCTESQICTKCNRSVDYLKDGEICDKCYIQSGRNRGNWIPFNKDSWDTYEDFRKWQYEYDRKKVKCDDCGKEMIRTSIYRHREVCK